MNESNVKIGAIFDYGTFTGQLEAGTDSFGSAMAAMGSQFRDFSAGAERSFAKISETSKATAASVSEDWKKAAAATGELSAAKRDLAAAQALVRQTAGEDANALALLAAAEQRVAVASEEAASAHAKAAAEIGISSSEIRESMLKTLESAKLTGAGISSVFGGLGTLLGAGIIGQLFSEWLTQTGETIDHLEHLHRATDISREDLQALQIAAQQLGISFDQVQTAIARLSKNAFAAVHNDTGVQAQAFHKLGIETKDLKELMNDFPELLLRVGEGLEKHAQGAARVGIAQTLMGRGSTLLAGSLGELALGAKQARTELETMGGIISEKDVAAAHDLDVTTARLSAGWRSLMLPVFESAVFFLKSIESVLIAAKGQIQGYESAWVSTAVSLKDTVVPVLKVIADVMTGQYTKAVDDAKAVWTRLKDANAAAVQAMEASNAEAAKKIGAIWADIQPGVKTKTDEIPDQPNKPKDRSKRLTAKGMQEELRRDKLRRQEEEDKANAEASRRLRTLLGIELQDEKAHNDEVLKDFKLKQQQLVAIQDESDRAHAAAERQITLDKAQFDYQQGLITARQLSAIQKKALEDERADELKALQHKLALYQKGTLEYAKVVAEMRKLDDKYRLEKQKLDEQAFTQSIKKYQDFFSSIGQNFKTSINGWLQGTQTFTQAMGKLWQSVALSAVESIEQIGIAWVNKHVFMALISKLFHVEKAKDDAVGAATEAAAGGATNTALATSAANLGAANAYAFWAWNPPVAAAMAATALAAGLAFAGAAGAAATAGAAGAGAASVGTVGFAARGAVLGRDQLIFAHEEEMILPPSLSRPLQKALTSPGGAFNGSGGSANVTIQQNVSALDGIGVGRVLRNNRRQVVKEVKRAVRMTTSRA